jgi:cbb3-type cytochrome oxidase subunit 3
MAKNSYPEELLSFLQECLTDGVITDKEREVLLKKAEKLGVDRDEFDLYIDAQKQKIDQTAQAASNRLRGLTCPYCGGSVQQMADKCPHCGETISPTVSKECEEIIDVLENALIDVKTDANETTIAQVERYMRKAKLYYGNNPKIKRLVIEVDEELDAIRERLHEEAKEAKRNALIKNVFKSKIFWFLIISAILGMAYSQELGLSAVAGLFMGVLGTASMVLPIYFIWWFVYGKQKKERERKEQMEHEERMAQLNNRRR